MPELPDVEMFRRTWARHGPGRKISRVATLDPGMVRNASPEELDRALRGQRLEEPERHGKWLIAPTSGPTLLVHFGMTGDLTWSESPEDRHPHDRVIVEVEGGELRYRNMRKFGGVWLATDAETEAIMGGLGPDALELDRADFVRLLRRRRGRIKAALMDQRLLAGVGNLVADEVLWNARVHPARRIEDLAAGDLERLHSSLRRVLTRWVEGYGALPRGWLIHARGFDGTCPRCGTPLERSVVGGRTTYHCPRCQAGRRQPKRPVT